MQKYRLKQWYPNLHLAWSTTDNYEYDREGNRMYNRTRWGTIPITAPYLHPDFWELIKEQKPLFITDDGVDVVNGMRIHSVRKSNFDRDSYIVDEDFVKEQTSKHPYVYFFHESNADEYIWKNKKVFSYEDVMKLDVVTFVDDKKHIMELAKKRSKNEF